MKLDRNLAMLLLGIYLIMEGLSHFLRLGDLRVIGAALALASGVLLVLRR